MPIMNFDHKKTAVVGQQFYILFQNCKRSFQMRK